MHVHDSLDVRLQSADRRDVLDARIKKLTTRPDRLQGRLDSCLQQAEAWLGGSVTMTE